MSSENQYNENDLVRALKAASYFERVLSNLARLRAYNLHDTEEMSASTAGTTENIDYRNSDGSYNDIEFPQMGAKGTRFGRNIPLRYSYPEDESTILTPDPLVVSEKLLARREFKPAKSINLLAAAWVQFQVHDWFGHELDERAPKWETEPSEERGSQVIAKRNRIDPPRSSDADNPPAYVNTEAQWWDGSQIYGNSPEQTRKLRFFSRGKLKTVIHEGNELLPVGPNGIDITGVTDNWWLGLSLFHTLFTLEHNKICDELYAKYGMSDEEIFNRARLINTALMAKIHTLEWSTAMIDDDRVINGLRADWWGVSEKSNLLEVVETLSRTTGKKNLPPHRLYGTSKDNFGAQYAMTEEFVAVYRMHPLIPDEIKFYCIDNPETEVLSVDFVEVANEKARCHLEERSTADLFYSFGVANPGDVSLHNYPDFLRNLPKKEEDGREVSIDLAALDILRDRERGIPRYNQFRQLIGLTACSDYLELTDGDKDLARQLKDVYGKNNIDRVDLMVGLFAEHPPAGFAFSRTALQIFTLMAPRRLKSDRFYTTDYTPRVYTPAGMEWIETNTLATVLKRNFRKLEDVLVDTNGAQGSQPNPFKPEAWRVGKQSA